MLPPHAGRWFCPSWPLSDPTTRQLCFWLPKETLWVSLVIWHGSTRPHGPCFLLRDRRITIANLRLGWREGMREKIGQFSVNRKQKMRRREKRTLKMTCNCMSACTRVWNLVSHHLWPRCVMAVRTQLLIHQNSGHLNRILHSHQRYWEPYMNILKQHVQRCKWRNLGADQLEALAIAGLGSGPAAAVWRRTPDWLRRWLSVYASGTFAAVGRSWCNVDVGLWGGRWRQQQMKRVGSRPRLYLRSTEMDLKMIFRPT